MKVVLVYDNIKDKELLELIEFPTPYFVEYVDTFTREGLKESYRIKGQFGARLNPFIVIYDDEDKLVQCFWSENGNAVHQFVNYLTENAGKD